MITAPVVGPQYDNPYEWQRDVLIVAQQQVDCSRWVQCLQAVKVGKNGSQKTLRHFNSANVQVSQIWQKSCQHRSQHPFLISHKAYWPVIYSASTSWGRLCVDPEDTSLPPPITSLSCVAQCLKSFTHNSLSAGMEVNLWKRYMRWCCLEGEWAQLQPARCT